VTLSGYTGCELSGVFETEIDVRTYEIEFHLLVEISNPIFYFEVSFNFIIRFCTAGRIAHFTLNIVQ
jgi:hypothetical protein